MFPSVGPLLVIFHNLLQLQHSAGRGGRARVLQPALLLVHLIFCFVAFWDRPHLTTFRLLFLLRLSTCDRTPRRRHLPAPRRAPRNRRPLLRPSAPAARNPAAPMILQWKGKGRRRRRRAGVRCMVRGHTFLHTLFVTFNHPYCLKVTLSQVSLAHHSFQCVAAHA